MRKWHLSTQASRESRAAHLLSGLIHPLGEDRFGDSLLETLQPWLPAASFSIYRTGMDCTPRLYLSGSHGIPDTTRACWRAYLSGPQRHDRTFAHDGVPDAPFVCHITAQEVPALHRARVYEAHGMAERVSVVQRVGSSLFALNFYRHEHQRPFADRQVADVEALALPLLALTQKHIALKDCARVRDDEATTLQRWTDRLRSFDASLTAREVDVCARLLMGMTQDGIASDLGLSLPTVKTYRNRAFARLGIHFRNELFALFVRV